MMLEKDVKKIYTDLEKFLIGQDRNGIDDQEVYEVAVQKYELLHKILEISGDPKWCS